MFPVLFMKSWNQNDRVIHAGSFSGNDIIKVSIPFVSDADEWDDFKLHHLKAVIIPTHLQRLSDLEF